MYFRRSHWAPAVVFMVAMSLHTDAQTATKRRTSPPANTPPAKQSAPPEQPKSEAWAGWNTLKPENEDFSILMPKDISTETTKFEYHKLELNTRLYLSAPAAGPVVAVASMSGIKSNPAAYSDFERFNSYADAFKTFFAPKVRKDAVAKMILTGAKPFHGYTGRVYKLTIGDLSGTVNAYVTRKRFYAIAVLNTKKDDALEDKFLSSFEIPDKPVDQPKTTAEAAEEANAATNNQNQRTDGRKPQVESEGVTPSTNQNSNPQENPTDTANNSAQPNAQPNQPQQPGQKRPPIAAGMLNAKALYLPVPEIPAGEKAGVVLVQVLVDEQGSVIDARAVSGPPSLHAAAVNAAKLARFLPTVLSGEPVRVSGTLSYNFIHAN